MSREQALKELSKAIESVNAKKFVSYVRQYVQSSKSIDSLLTTPAPASEKLRKQFDACYDQILKEAGAILSQSALSLRYLIDFPYLLNGGSRLAPEIRDPARRCFRNLKQHQMELLASVSDEIEIITAILRLSQRIRTVVRSHSETIQNALSLTEIIRERIANRPTTALRVSHHHDEKIQELNQTLDDMNLYENRQETILNQDSANCFIEKALADYLGLIQFSSDEVRQRTDHIQTHIEELKEGWKVFYKLAVGSYSDRIQKAVETLMRNHQHRTRVFRTNILESREQYIGIRIDSPPNEPR